MDTASSTTELLSWNDTIKIVLGFVSSALLVWLGVFIRARLRKRILKRSVWNVLKNHTSLDGWLMALDEMCTAANGGNAYTISFDVSVPLSKLVSELAALDPLKSDIYYDLLGWEEVVRKGLKKINELQMELAKSRTDGIDWSTENISLRKMISSQCDVLRRDVISMYSAQLDLMKYIQIQRNDAVDPVETLEKSLSKTSKTDS